MANWVRYPLPLFSVFPPWRACEAEVRYPPPQKGYLSDTRAIPYENKANGRDTPLCDTISKGYCAIWGVSRTGPLSFSLDFPGVSGPTPPSKNPRNSHSLLEFSDPKFQSDIDRLGEDAKEVGTARKRHVRIKSGSQPHIWQNPATSGRAHLGCTLPRPSEKRHEIFPNSFEPCSAA